MKINNTKAEIEKLKNRELVITSLTSENSRKQLEKEIGEALENKGSTVRRNFDSEMIKNAYNQKKTTHKPYSC